MRASGVFKPPQLSFQQRSHHYEFWVLQLVGGQKSRSRHTFLVKKKNFSWWSSIKSEAYNCFNHALLQSATAGVMSFREVASKLSKKNKQHREKYSKVSTNTPKCQQKLQCTRLRLRRDDKSAKQTSSWTTKKKLRLLLLFASKDHGHYLLKKKERWLTKDQQLFFF